MFTVEARMQEVKDFGRVRYPSFLRTKKGSLRVGNGWYWLPRADLSIPDPEKPQYTDNTLEYILEEVVENINSGFNVRVVTEEGVVVWQRYPE